MLSIQALISRKIIFNINLRQTLNCGCLLTCFVNKNRMNKICINGIIERYYSVVGSVSKMLSIQSYFESSSVIIGSFVSFAYSTISLR